MKSLCLRFCFISLLLITSKTFSGTCTPDGGKAGTPIKVVKVGTLDSNVKFSNGSSVTLWWKMGSCKPDVSNSSVQINLQAGTFFYTNSIPQSNALGGWTASKDGWYTATIKLPLIPGVTSKTQEMTAKVSLSVTSNRQSYTSVPTDITLNNLVTTTPALKVTTITPKAGTIGGNITIQGSGFVANDMRVYILTTNGYVSAAIKSITATAIVAQVPTDVTCGLVLVQRTERNSASGAYSKVYSTDTFYIQPKIALNKVYSSTAAGIVRDSVRTNEKIYLEFTDNANPNVELFSDIGFSPQITVDIPTSEKWSVVAKNIIASKVSPTAPLGSKKLNLTLNYVPTCKDAKTEMVSLAYPNSVLVQDQAVVPTPTATATPTPTSTPIASVTPTPTQPPPVSDSEMTENCWRSAGLTKEWQGTGACTGNLLTVIPLGGALSISHNSVKPSGDFGFGKAGWRLTADERLVVLDPTKGDRIDLYDGYQTKIPFKKSVDSKWRAEKWYTEDYLEKRGNNFVRVTTEGVEQEFVPTTSDAKEYRLFNVKDWNGNTQTESFKNTNSPIIVSISSINIAAPSGSGIETTTFNNDGEKITSITLLDRSNVELSYSSNQLTQVRYPNGMTYSISYNSDNTISRITDPFHQEVNYTYSKGMLQNIRTADDSIDYEYADKYVSTKNKDGEIREELNEKGAVIFSVAYGAKTAFVRSDKNFILPLEIRNHLGQKWKYEYDSNNNVKKVINPAGITSTFTYTGDKLTQAIIGKKNYSFSYSGNLLSTASLPDGDVLSYVYDDKTNVKSVTKDGKTTSLLNRADGSPTTIDYPDGSSESFVYDTRSRVKEIIDNESKTQIQYDQMNRITKVTEGSKVYDYDYDELGVLKSTKVTGKNGNAILTEYTLGYNGELTTTQTVLAKSERPKVTTVFEDKVVTRVNNVVVKEKVGSK